MGLTNFLSSEQGGFFLQNSEESNNIKNVLIQFVKDNPVLSKYDQFSSYHYKNPNKRHTYFLYRIEKLIQAAAGEWVFFYEITEFGPYLLGARQAEWDENHFGFKMANLQIFLCPSSPVEKEVLKRIIVSSNKYLKGQGVKFINARINGDNINALHAMEDEGFRYYDNVIWPVVSAKLFDDFGGVRLMKTNEADEVKYIAENFQYQRGHYYCDERFDKKIIDRMYPKWIDTTIRNNEPIAVIERNNKIAGFFVFKIDEELGIQTGFSYGRLRLLALDTQFRGTGAGEELFKGTLALIKSMGADFIDSGYSTKNHISAKLHNKSSFMSAYEEVTFHKWID